MRVLSLFESVAHSFIKVKEPQMLNIRMQGVGLTVPRCQCFRAPPLKHQQVFRKVGSYGFTA